MSYTLHRTSEIAFGGGKDLARATDLFDAAIAAYTTFLFHSSQGKACQAYGSIAEGGFIIVPRVGLFPN